MSVLEQFIRLVAVLGFLFVVLPVLAYQVSKLAAAGWRRGWSAAKRYGQEKQTEKE